tara:strand:- start:352 stop:768 length:417 start_codon:yes stop_codon:yes gene_type:complete
MIREWKIVDWFLEPGTFETKWMKEGYQDQGVYIVVEGNPKPIKVSMWKHIIENFIYYTIHNIKLPKIFKEVVEELFKNEDGLYDPEKGRDGRDRLKKFILKVMNENKSVVQAMKETQFPEKSLLWAESYWNKKPFNLK